MFKHTLPSFIRLIVPAVVWKVKTSDNTVYLTFDDGPHPEITPWVLHQLQSFNAKATFFCVGHNVKKFPQVYNEVLAQKHAVGNHTYNHVNGWETNNEMYLANVQQCATLVSSKLFRPPYGRVSPVQLLKLRKQGYHIIMWDVLTCDYEANLDIKKTISNCMKIVRPGSIIVFHDSEKAFHNLQQLLPAMLQQLHNAGYTFKALT